MTAKQTGQRKTQTGRVLSDAGDKTIVIRVERLQQHPVYKRVIRRTAKFAPGLQARHSSHRQVHGP